MAYKLVNLVTHHGPPNLQAWAVLMVIAEEQRTPFQPAKLSAGRLAGNRMSLKSAKRAVAALIRDEWVTHQAGAGRNPSRYWINLERFPAEAVERHYGDASEPAVTPVDNENPVGSHRPHKIRSGVTQSTSGVTQTPISVSVSTSVPPTSHSDPLPGLLYEVGQGRMDGQKSRETTAARAPAPPVTPALLDSIADVVLADVPPRAQPRDRDGLLQVLSTAVENGWTAEGLRDEFQAQNSAHRFHSGGGTLHAIRALAGTPAPAGRRRPTPKPTWCGRCDPDTRQRPDGAGMIRCPDCHPLSRQLVAG